MLVASKISSQLFSSYPCNSSGEMSPHLAKEKREEDKESSRIIWAAPTLSLTRAGVILKTHKPSNFTSLFLAQFKSPVSNYSNNHNLCTTTIQPSSESLD